MAINHYQPLDELVTDWPLLTIVDQPSLLLSVGKFTPFREVARAKLSMEVLDQLYTRRERPRVTRYPEGLRGVVVR